MQHALSIFLGCPTIGICLCSSVVSFSELSTQRHLFPAAGVSCCVSRLHSSSWPLWRCNVLASELPLCGGVYVCYGESCGCFHKGPASICKGRAASVAVNGSVHHNDHCNSNEVQVFQVCFWYIAGTLSVCVVRLYQSVCLGILVVAITLAAASFVCDMHELWRKCGQQHSAASVLGCIFFCRQLPFLSQTTWYCCFKSQPRLHSHLW